MSTYEDAGSYNIEPEIKVHALLTKEKNKNKKDQHTNYNW